MTILGIEGMSPQQIVAEVRRGARFVVFGWCMSLLVITLRRSSEVIFIPPGDSTGKHGLRFTLLTLLLGWWGIPWGPIYSISVLVQNLNGGKDVTDHIMEQLGASAPVGLQGPRGLAPAGPLRRHSISRQPRGGAQRFVGAVLTVFGSLFLALGPVMAIWPAEGDSRSDAFSVLVFAVPLLIPGVLLWRAGRKKLRAAKGYEVLVAFLRTERRIELGAVAARLQTDLPRARQAIEIAVQRGDVDLVRAPDAEHYVHREELAEAVTVGGRRCHSCHAPVAVQLVLPGEAAACPFCGVALDEGLAALG